MARDDDGVVDENVHQQSPRKKQRLKKESVGGDRKKTPRRVRKKSLLNEIDGSNSNSNSSSKNSNSNCNDNINNGNNNSSTNNFFSSSSTSSSISLSPSPSDNGYPNDGSNNNRKSTTPKTINDGFNLSDGKDEETSFDHLEEVERELCEKLQNLLNNAIGKYDNSEHKDKVMQAFRESLFDKDVHVDPCSHEGALLRMLESLGDDPQRVFEQVAQSLLTLLTPTLLKDITTNGFHIEESQLDSKPSLAEKLEDEIDPNETEGNAVVYMLIFEGTVQEVIKKLEKALSIPNFEEIYPEMSVWAPKMLERLRKMLSSKRIRIVYIGEISSLNQTVIKRWESETNPKEKDGAATQWEFHQIIGWTHRVVVAFFKLGDKGLSWMMECFVSTLIKCFSNRSAANGNGRQIQLLASDTSSCNKVCTGPPHFLLYGGSKSIINYVRSNYKALKNASILSESYVPQHLLSFINDMLDTIKRHNKDVKDPKDITGYIILRTMGKICEEKGLGIFAYNLTLASSVAEKLVSDEVASSIYDATNLQAYIDALVLEGQMSEEEARKLAERYRATCRTGDRLNLASSVAEKFVSDEVASSKYDATNLQAYIDALVLEGKMSEEEARKLAESYRSQLKGVSKSAAKLNLASSVAAELVTARIASSIYDATNTPGYTDAIARHGKMSEEEARKLAESYRSRLKGVSESVAKRAAFFEAKKEATKAAAAAIAAEKEARMKKLEEATKAAAAAIIAENEARMKKLDQMHQNEAMHVYHRWVHHGRKMKSENNPDIPAPALKKIFNYLMPKIDPEIMLSAFNTKKKQWAKLLELAGRGTTWEAEMDQRNLAIVRDEQLF